MNRLALEQKTHTNKQRLAELAALLDGPSARALTNEERNEIDSIEAEQGALQHDLDFFRRQSEAQRSEAAAGAGVRIDQDGDNPAAAAKHPLVFQTLGHQLSAIYRYKVNGDQAAFAQLMAAASGASEAIDSDGGFMIQSDLAAGIERRMHDVGTLLGLMNPIEVSGNGLTERMITETSRANGSRSGGVQGYWVDEAEAPTDSRPKFEKIETKLHKVAALGYSTDELLEDFPAMSSLFESEFAEELVFKVEDAIIEGDGASMPLGIMAAPALITQAKETGQAADTFVTANISQMWNRFPVRSRANAVWLANQELEPQLDVLSIPVGTAALEPRFVTYNQDGVLRIKGRPVVFLEYCSALGDLGDIILADMTQYRLVRKGGVSQASSMHVLFTTDQMAFRAIYRIGGQVKWRSALTPFKATSGRTVSPFVTLAAR